MGTYTVIVGNVGTVCETNCCNMAGQTYERYVKLSKDNFGGYSSRCYGEDVTLYENGEPIREHIGHLNSDTEEKE